MSEPKRIDGTWHFGWTLDVHTISSTFLGYDEFGHAQYDTERSELGELVYQLKYKGKAEAADQIAKAMAEFLRPKVNLLDRTNLVVAVPPSRAGREAQPVEQIAQRLATLLGKAFAPTAVKKTRETPQLKNLHDWEERREALVGAFEGDPNRLKGQGVLLIDDLYRSGATANAAAHAMIAAGAIRVYFLAATRTRASA
jgi:competence protein ComFC